MKDIFATVGKITGLIFAALVICFTSWLTWLLAARLIPDNTILQFMTIALFDGGALIWFIQFITQAKGTMQWAVAGIGWVIGLAGAVIMAGGELIMGQQLVTLDDPTTLGWVLVATVIVAALAHAVLIYTFHFVEPAVKNRIENAQQVSKAIEKAYGDARQEIERNAQELTESLRQSVMFEAQQQIGAQTAAHIRGAGLLAARTGETLRGGVVIPAQARDAEPGPAILAEQPAPPRPTLHWPWRPARKAKPAEKANPAPVLDPALVAALAEALATVMRNPTPAGQYATETVDATGEARKNGREGSGQ